MGDTPRDEPEIRVHPLVAKFVEAIEGGEGIVELQGFIGPAREGDDLVTLYATLELTDRVLVPRDAIIHVEEPEPERRNEEPTRVYVKASAELRVITSSVTTVRADEASATVWQAQRPWWARKRDAFWMCEHLLRSCIETSDGDIGTITTCFYHYELCMRRARLSRR